MSQNEKIFFFAKKRKKTEKNGKNGKKRKKLSTSPLFFSFRHLSKNLFQPEAVAANEDGASLHFNFWAAGHFVYSHFVYSHFGYNHFVLPFY
jgi:hypothetical protein